MKSVYFLILLGTIATISACNQFKSDHPQTELLTANATDLTAKSILKYTTAIDQQASALQQTTSLIYMLGDLSFYVAQYRDHGQTVLLVEHAFNGGLSSNLKKYYFRNDSLVFETSKNEINNEDGIVFKEERTYLRNNTVFKVENRTASAETEIKSLPYIDLPLSKNANSDKSHLENVSTLQQLLNGTDKFDMVFESISTYPDSRYIILRGKIQPNYTASILVKEKDAFIDSLLNDPLHFENQKLAFKWVVKNQEAIYVPVMGNTSANGLKR